MQKKSKYLVNSAFYTLMPLFRTVFGFITLPIMTRFLSPNDYGVISLITMIMSFNSVFYIGINQASFRFFFKYKSDDNKLSLMLSTNLIFVVLASLLYGGLVLGAYPFLNAFFFGDKLPLIWVMLAFVQYSLIYMNTINQNIIQSNHDGSKWFVNELVATVISVSLSVGLVVSRLCTYQALIIAPLAAELFKCLMLFVQLRSFYRPKFSWAHLKESVYYSWPQTPTTIISYGYSYFDRILLSKFQGLSQVGVLDVSNRFSSMVKMIQDGIGGALSPLTLELLTENNQAALKKLADINLKVVFFLLFIALSLIMLSKELITLLTTEKYYFAIYIFPLYVYNYIFSIFGMLAYWLIYYHPQKTFWRIPLNIIGFSSIAFFNILLIPRYGLMGAAVAMFISSAVTQLTSFNIGMRITPIPMDKIKIYAMFGLSVLETAVLYYLYYLKPVYWLELGIKLFMLVLFVAVCALLKAFYFSDIKEMLGMLFAKLKTSGGRAEKIYERAIESSIEEKKAE